jgi:hypothetical protein
MLIVVLVAGVLLARNLGGGATEVVEGVRSDVSGVVTQSRAVKDAFDQARTTIDGLNQAKHDGEDRLAQVQAAQRALERARVQAAQAIARAERREPPDPAEIKRLKADARRRLTALQNRLELALD